VFDPNERDSAKFGWEETANIKDLPWWESLITATAYESSREMFRSTGGYYII
jgi:hypothetical protein